MLNRVDIATLGGIALWSRVYGAQAPILGDILVSIIEERASAPVDDVSSWSRENTAVQFTLDNDKGLIFAVTYDASLDLAYIGPVLRSLKASFVSEYADTIAELTAICNAGSGRVPEKRAFAGADALFNDILHQAQNVYGAGTREKVEISADAPASEGLTHEDIAKNLTALKNRKKKKGKKDNSVPETNGGATNASNAPPKFDYSDDKEPLSNAGPSLVPTGSNVGGKYVLADFASTREPSTQESSSWLGGLMSRFSYSKKLSHEDIDPLLAQIRQHLVSKNVASDIAGSVCDSVTASLLGKSISGFTTVKQAVNGAMEQSLVRILTPKQSTDILADISAKQTKTKEPYTIVFVGVNGVGKSTNLSKVAYWLLQNNYRVLIAAGDTFRSGAVEQLRVHVQNLQQLDHGKIELFEKGYGKDASGIARDAIKHASEAGFDIVLIDTAGRMQDNEPLMRALSKLIAVNHPDKVIFVGEALAGSEAVDQVAKFHRTLQDMDVTRRSRGIDGMLLTKFDTIDDKVGAAVSMTHVTGQPIFFVGTGQTYSDLRNLRVGHLVDALIL